MNPQAEGAIRLLSKRAVWQVTGAILVAWFFGYYGLGFWWSLWLVPLYLTWERIHTSRKIRMQVQKYAEIIMAREDPQIESVDWLNTMMTIGWPCFGPYISDLVMKESATALEANKPMMVSKMCLEGVTMGDVAPTMSQVIVYKSTPDMLDIECSLDFHSNIAMEMAAYTKPARVPILVKDVEFVARCRIVAWLIPREPFLSKMQISFLQRPFIDVTVKPISVGPDVINLVPGLSGSIKDMFIGMFSDQWIQPKYLEIVLERPEEDGPLEIVAEEKTAKKGVIGGSVSAVTGGVSAVGGMGVDGARAVGGAAAAVGGMGVDSAKAVSGAAVAGVGKVGSMGVDSAKAVSGALSDSMNKVNPFAKKKSKDGDEVPKKEKSKSKSLFGFGRSKSKLDLEEASGESKEESEVEVSETEDGSEKKKKKKSRKNEDGTERKTRKKKSKKTEEDGEEKSKKEKKDKEDTEVEDSEEHHSIADSITDSISDFNPFKKKKKKKKKDDSE